MFTNGKIIVYKFMIQFNGKIIVYEFMIQFYSYLYFCQSYSWNKDYLINYSQ